MYLKTIEVQGFKSFANKIIFEFHNGITGIVGPNGSGKSNIADAVRWVLGEQSAKQLRGANMQDVIFSGTENRRPLGGAYVAITLDNRDHQLPVDYEEVAVARRVYRSGESEYLLNGSVCRLRDIQELFYDTGIGKEGYSIIGQGQIEKVISGRPEERRELFDEACGIVKYKKRKAEAFKKLENERQNISRVSDILSELEKQIPPLERQSKAARIYLQKKEDLKQQEVNLFLLETDRLRGELSQTREHLSIAKKDLEEASQAHEAAKREYGRIEEEMERLESGINQDRESIHQKTLLKEKLEGELKVLRERILGAKENCENFNRRIAQLEQEAQAKRQERETYEGQSQDLTGQLASKDHVKTETGAHLETIQGNISALKEKIEAGKSEILRLITEKSSTKAKLQRFDAMQEQANIRKAELNQKLLTYKSDESGQRDLLEQYEKELEKTGKQMAALSEKEQGLQQTAKSLQAEGKDQARELEEQNSLFYRTKSRLDSLKNLSERYEGYGQSIRRVMEQREGNPGIIGVVADIIQVGKEYETAIETALGGSIQNIVTDTEETAKAMILFLKQHKYGRATFLPLTGISSRGAYEDHDALKEAGVLGLASGLVSTKEEYRGVILNLLGRTLVVDHIDTGIGLARKYSQSLRIVTLSGELLNPGGSMTGGAFKNSSNLLGRRREMEELEQSAEKIGKTIEKIRKKIASCEERQQACQQQQQDLKEKKQALLLEQNTIRLNLQNARERKEELERELEKLQAETRQIQAQLRDIRQNQDSILEECAAFEAKERETEQQVQECQEDLEGLAGEEKDCSAALSEMALEYERLKQNEQFNQENLRRITRELEKIDKDKEQLTQEAERTREESLDLEKKVEQLEADILSAEGDSKSLSQALEEKLGKKEELTENYKGFFDRREALSLQMSGFDKEVFRLQNRAEKLEEQQKGQADYIWEEYALTYHNALPLRQEEFQNTEKLRRQIGGLKEEIRNLGDVNVNAIEDYKNLMERFGFLDTQRKDLQEAEQALLAIIAELDQGMRSQFTEKFAQIQGEFDRTFQALFGGGKGTLSLMEEEDLLEAGIRIIAQPPGKKLQNMMQLSGGEKSLTAIALLFAIQNLKPSPFCLLDEIEAALDESNVDRFASYLCKLTKHTQFIVITHRRGTMSAADRLYGITMQEKGVSVLVSVNLIEAELEQ